MNLNDTPIQRKLMSVILLTCATVLFVMCSAYIVLEYFSFRRALTTNITALSGVIASNSSAALAFDSQDDAVEILDALKAEKHIVAAALYDKKGKLFATYPLHISAETFPKTIEDAGFNFSGGFLEGFQPVMQENKSLGTLYIRSDLKEMYSRLQQYGIIGILLTLGSLVIAYYLSKLLQKSISEPILALKETAKTISEKSDYSVRAYKRSNDEVGELTDAFNLMLMQIETQNREITSFNQRLEKTVKERTVALQHQIDFVETIINSSVDIIAVFDDSLNYIMLNKKAFDVYQIKQQEVIGKNILEVFPEIEHSPMYTNLKKSLQDEHIHDQRYRSPVLNRYFENFYIPLKNNENTVYGVLAIGHDISGIVEASEKIEEVNFELIKSNRDLEQFAYIASHDLQEPLRKIQTFTQIIGEDYSNHGNVEKYHGKIRDAALRMQNLIQDVLNFSRISNSEDAFVKADLNIIIENLKKDFELILEEKQAVINHPDLPVIIGIPLQLSQLFSNIISNAIKYCDKKPVINISVSKASEKDITSHSKLNKDISYIKIEFADNGIGFDPQFSEQIFNIFQRLHGKQTYSGTGIGLALCKKIVENHQGIIYAKGEVGIGSTFTVVLPA